MQKHYSATVAEHNLPFTVEDHYTKLCKKMFPNSEAAMKFSCSRAKTTQIVKRAIASCLNKIVIDHRRLNAFSLAIDESNDRKSDKNLMILLRILIAPAYEVCRRGI